MTDRFVGNTEPRERTMTGPPSSFLVRCWVEPREVEGAEPVVRFTLRNLQTGEEQHLTDARQIGERILRQAESAAGAGAELQEAGAGRG